MVKYSITLGLNSAITDFVINFEKMEDQNLFIVYFLAYIGIYWVTSDLMIKFKKKQEKDVTESFL